MSSVEVGITHEIKIGREKAWIKVGVTLDLDPGEEVVSGIERATDVVNESIFKTIESTVEAVEKYEESK